MNARLHQNARHLIDFPAEHGQLLFKKHEAPDLMIDELFQTWMSADYAKQLDLLG